jgi:Leucine Rich Repeat (LRR) protein
MTSSPPPATKSRLRLSFGWWLAGLLLAAVAVMFMAVAVVAYRARSQAALVAELERNGALASHAAGYWHTFGRDRGDPPPVSEAVPGWLRDRLGEDFFDDVVSVSAAHFEPKSEELLPLSSKQTRAVCSLCRRLPKLRSFSIRSDSFEIEDIAVWPHFSKLESLEVMSDALADGDLATIGKLNHLDHLELQSTQITDTGLQNLAGLSGLRELGLGLTAVTDNGFRHLAGMKNLSTLSLICPQLGDEGALSIDASQLRTLNVGDCQIGDRGLSHLVSGGRIRRLTVKKTRITDACLAEVAKCQRLGLLNLRQTNITDAGLAALAGLPIEFLRLEESPITDRGLEHLGGLGFEKKLSLLSLRDTKVTGTGAEFLQGYAYIGRLDLSGAPLTREGCEELAKLKLSHLVLDRTPIGDEELLLFAGLDDASSLDVRQTKVTPSGVRRFYESLRSPLNLQCDFHYEDLPPPESAPAGDSAPNESGALK